MIMKTLSFQKETVRALVSVEVDAVVGGAAVIGVPRPGTSLSGPAKWDTKRTLPVVGPETVVVGVERPGNSLSGPAKWDTKRTLPVM
jgi:hypothetical protein